MEEIPVRSRALLALGLACLGLSGALGTLLVHDGEVGTDEATLHRAGVGDQVRLKGEAVPAHVPPLAGLLEHTTGFATTDEVRVLVTWHEPLPEGELIVEGTVLHAVPDPLDPERPLIVLQLTDVRTPIVFG